MELSNNEILTLVSLVGGSFVATNLDNLFILVVLLGSNTRRRMVVLLGYICSGLAVLVTSAIGVALGSLLGPQLIGYLGLAPLLLGIHMLYCQWRGQQHQQPEVASLHGRSAAAIWLSTFALMFSNSGDSIAVFLPLLAESGRSALPLIIGSYLLMALLWAGLGMAISGQRALAVTIERRAEKLVPWIMIGVGTYILLDTATDSLL